ncbi:MAG TPA: T9SS type A sorting domain-containing protein [Ferruginibacter sp.]|nr:T9SS type A sorting domain-containing protein [Ferruginibacter sp.]
MKNQKVILIAGLILCLLANSALYAQVQTARYNTIAQHSNAFYEYLPAGYPEVGVKYPLMIFLHGQGELGPGTTATLSLVLRNGPPKLIAAGTFPQSFTVNSQTFKFIVLSPQFNLRPWDTDIESIITYAKANYAVDINRIYLTGLSMGGGIVWEYTGNTLSNAARLAAIVPVAGASAPYTASGANMANANLPVWATHNNGDNIVPVAYTDNYIALINSQPVPPNPLAKKSIFISTSHDAWSLTYNPTFKENGLNIYEWMLQYKRNFTVLPVTGLVFNATLDTDKKVKLLWNTLTEINNQGFNILRSTDGTNFSNIGFVTSSASNGAGANYTFTDNSPVNGKSYYRLELTGADNQKTYSEIKAIQRMESLEISFYPNPVQTVLNIKTATPLMNAQLRISNANGQNVLQQTLSGNGNITVKVASLPAGIYYAKIIEEGNQQRFKFIKE